MHTVTYDGTLPGLFTAVFEIYEYRITDPDLHKQGWGNISLFGTVHEVTTNREKAMRVMKRVREKLSPLAVEQLYKMFLSEVPGMENVLYRYIRYVLASLAAVENDYSHPDVLAVQQTVKKVEREKHRMEAFIRFKKASDGLFYAVVEPDFNVLPLISKHFEERYADQRWLICDGTRRYGLYYDLSEVSEVTIDFMPGACYRNTTCILHDEQETLYQELWKVYFNSVNIQARQNMKLHVQQMPRRYWKHLTEKSI